MCKQAFWTVDTYHACSALNQAPMHYSRSHSLAQVGNGVHQNFIGDSRPIFRADYESERRLSFKCAQSAHPGVPLQKGVLGGVQFTNIVKTVHF